MKIILITGTSTGLGLNLAIQAAAAGHKVYASMRSLTKRCVLDAAAKEAGVSIELLQLDVQDSDSVNAAVAQIIVREGRLDVLINNAGAGFVRTTEQATEGEISSVMDVNFMGVVRCVKAVIPHMRQQRAGHIVTISSVGGLVGQPFNEIYCAAKFAVEGYMESLASYVTPAFGIHFTTIEPGGIHTEFAASVFKQVADTGGMLNDEYLPILQTYIAAAQSRSANGVYQTAAEVAAVVMSSIDAKVPPVRMRTSPWSEEFTRLKTGLDPDGKKLQSQIHTDLLGGMAPL